MIVARPRYHADATPTTHNRLHWCQAINYARDSVRKIVVVTAHVNDVLLAGLPNLAPQARQLIDGSGIVEHGDGTISEEVRKEGEAAILWFNKVLAK